MLFPQRSACCIEFFSSIIQLFLSITDFVYDPLRNTFQDKHICNSLLFKNPDLDFPKRSAPQVPFSAVALARTPSKKANVLFLEENRAIALTPARVRCEDSAQRKTTKMASEITVVGDEEIQFLSSVSLPNLRQALEENFLDSDSGYEDCTSDSDDGSENILEKSCSEDASDMSDEAFPLDGRNVLREKKASKYENIS